MRLLRRNARTWTTATAAVLTLLVTSAGLADAASASSSTQASVEVAGTLVRLADEPAHHADAGAPGASTSTTDSHDEHRSGDAPSTMTALRTADGTLVPVDEDAVQDLDGGTRVTVTAQVPPTVVAAARADGATTAPDGSSVKVNRADLREGTSGPAKTDSQLTKATVAAASSTGTPLRATKTTVAGASTASATTYSRAVHDITVAVVVPRGVTGASATATQIRNQVANASAYWSGVSGGGITLRVAKISARYVSAYRCGDDVFAMWSEAAKRTGFTEAPNKHLVISFPKEAAGGGCPYGLASIGSGVNSGGVALVSDTAWPVLAHEVGHNFGLGHAKALRCNRADVNLDSLPSGCSLVEYGYPWDVMAASSTDSAGTLSAVQASRIGLLTSAHVVQATPGSRAVTLQPMASGTGVRAVRIADPASDAVYFVEYRVRTGRDLRLYQNMPNGVRVLKVDRTSWQERGSVVLDATPTGSANDIARQVPVGSTWRSTSGAVSVRVAAAGATANVTVAVGSAAAAPTRTAGVATGVTVSAPAIDATAATGPRARISWRGGPAGARYDVQVQEVGVNARGARSLGPVRTWRSGTRATSANYAGRAGTHVQFRARANGGAWSSWRSVTFAVDATARGFSASRGWASGRLSAYYGGTYSSTAGRGAWIQRPATATNRISIIGPRHARGGVARVYVNGRLRATVNTYAPSTRQRQVLASIAVPWGAHTVRIVHAGAPRTNIIVDAIAYGR